MPKFRKKPIDIEAMKFITTSIKYFDNLVVEQFGDPLDFRPCRHCKAAMSAHGWLHTLEGGRMVCPGDWIIKGVVGEFYTCKPDIFAAKYDAV